MLDAKVMVKTIFEQNFLKEKIYLHTTMGFANYEHKKRDSAESQTFVNLKSNTMKNTVQS